MERFDEAIEVMNRLLAIQPDKVMAHTNLSVFYMKLGDKETAEVHKAKATSTAFKLKMEEVRREKERQAQLEEATPSSKPSEGEAVQASETPSAPPEKEAPALTEEQRKALEEKIGLFEHALQFSPDDPLAHYGLGSAYLELQQYEEARPHFEATLAKQANHSQCYSQLGQCLEALGETKQAATLYEKGIEVASQRGDLMPLQSMQDRLNEIGSRPRF